MRNWLQLASEKGWESESIPEAPEDFEDVVVCLLDSLPPTQFFPLLDMARLWVLVPANHPISLEFPMIMHIMTLLEREEDMNVAGRHMLLRFVSRAYA
jgi:hypothetical protein